MTRIQERLRTLHYLGVKMRAFAEATRPDWVAIQNAAREAKFEAQCIRALARQSQQRHCEHEPSDKSERRLVAGDLVEQYRCKLCGKRGIKTVVVRRSEVPFDN